MKSNGCLFGKIYPDVKAASIYSSVEILVWRAFDCGARVSGSIHVLEPWYLSSLS